MLSIIYFFIILGFAIMSLRGQTVFVLCGFYFVYGVLKVLALGDLMDWKHLVIFQVLYCVLLFSLVTRVIWESDFTAQIRIWPLVSYFFLVALMLASALYSPSSRPFSPDKTYNLWGRLVIVSLFWLAAAQIRRKEDLRIMTVTTVGVSLVLSIWVILTASQLHFEALRGGIDVNQNYVSGFVLLGALSAINFIFISKSVFLKACNLAILLCIMLASLILASRGMLAAFLVGGIILGARVMSGLHFRAILSFGVALLAVFILAFILPGSEQFLNRFQEASLGTLNERSLIWSTAIRYFSDSGIVRMIFGQGLSSGAFVIKPVLVDYENYHNEYLTWLLDQGIVGLLAFIGFFGCVLRSILKCDHPLKSLMLAWLTFFVVAGLSSTVSDLHLFWITLGTIISASSLAQVPGRLSASAQDHPPLVSLGGGAVST